MGFQSYSLRHFGELEGFLEQAGRLGLHHVELYRGHLPTSTPLPELEQVRKRLASAGLTVNAFGVEHFSEDHEANEALFKFGKALGVRGLSADPTKDAFVSLEKLVKQYDVQIAIHNHGPEDERWRRPEWILEAGDGSRSQDRSVRRPGALHPCRCRSDRGVGDVGSSCPRCPPQGL